MGVTEKLQKAIQETARIHEESWNPETTKYEIDIRDAASRACADVGFDTRMEQVVFLLLFCCWNDALSWAEKR